MIPVYQHSIMIYRNYGHTKKRCLSEEAVENVHQLAPPFKNILPQSQSAFTAPGPACGGTAVLGVEARTKHS